MSKRVLALGLTVGLLGAGNAALAGLTAAELGGVGVVCDDDYTPVGASSHGLIWTADANLAATTTFGVSGINASGIMTWDKAVEWIAAMNAENYGGANDWRLWSALNSDGTGPCFGADCTDSELGHLFYTEGGLSQGQPISSSPALSSVFTNIQDSVYWSGTGVASDSDRAWYFGAGGGGQFTGGKFIQYYGWAVRPGQCPAAPPSPPQPIPTISVWGLGALSLLLMVLGRARLR